MSMSGRRPLIKFSVKIWQPQMKVFKTEVKPRNRGQMKVFKTEENGRGGKYVSTETGAFNVRNKQRLLG